MSALAEVCRKAADSRVAVRVVDSQVDRTVVVDHNRAVVADSLPLDRTVVVDHSQAVLAGRTVVRCKGRLAEVEHSLHHTDLDWDPVLDNS